MKEEENGESEKITTGEGMEINFNAPDEEDGKIAINYVDMNRKVLTTKKIQI